MNILYTGPFRYPLYDAGGKRVFSIINILKNFSNVTVTSWGNDTTEEAVILDELECKSNNKIKKAVHFLLLGLKTLKHFNYDFRKFDVVVIYNPPFVFSIILYILSRIQKFKVIIESNEWYESSHLPGGKYGPAAIENFLRMRLAYLLFDDFIVMSEFLEKYYQKYNKNVVRIPPLTADVALNRDVRCDNILRLMYAGSPGKKDKVDEIVNSYLSLNQEFKEKVEIVFIGFTLVDFLKMYPKFNGVINCEKNIFFLGRRPMTFVYDYYSKVDYTIFLRERKRYAYAGFPSKFVESLAYTTPVITNRVGDISKYIDRVGLSYEPNAEPFSDVISKAFAEKSNFYSNIKFLNESVFGVDVNTKKLECIFGVSSESI